MLNKLKKQNIVIINKKIDLAILKNIKKFKVENICFIYLNLNEETAHIIKDIILETYKNLQKKYENKNEKIGKELYKDDLKNMIFSLIQTFLYLENISIFDLITQIFIRIITKHYLINGNKRLGISNLYLILISFGYKLIYQSNYLKDKIHYKKCKKFVIILQNKDCSDLK